MFYSHQKKDLQKIMYNVDKLDAPKSIKPDGILLNAL